MVTVGCNVDFPPFAEEPELFYVVDGLPWRDFERASCHFHDEVPCQQGWDQWNC